MTPKNEKKNDASVVCLIEGRIPYAVLWRSFDEISKSLSKEATP